MKKIVVLMMCALLISGCSTKSTNVIEYESESQESTDVSNNQFTDGENIQFNCQTADNININVDVRVDVPQDINMNVVEVEDIKYSEAEKEKITQNFFDDGKVFVYDVRRKEATDTATKDYSENAFWGMKGDYAFVVDFMYREIEEKGKMVEDEENGYRYAIYPVDARKIMPDKIAKCEKAGTEVTSSNSDKDNKCKYSEDEARKIAEDTLKNLGIDGYDVISAESIGWHGGNDAGDHVIETTDNEIYGYYFSFALSMDEANDVYATDVSSGMQNGNIDYYTDITGDDTDDSILSINDVPYLGVAVGDDGVMYLQANKLFNITKTDSQSKLLSLSVIQGILQDKLETMDESYLSAYIREQNAPYTINYNNKLSLQYNKENRINSDKHYYLPMWELSPVGSGAPIIRVNAIDGTVTNEYGEQI